MTSLVTKVLTFPGSLPEDLGTIFLWKEDHLVWPWVTKNTVTEKEGDVLTPDYCVTGGPPGSKKDFQSP